MILLHIIPTKQEHVKEILELLIKEQLILKPIIFDKVQNANLLNGEIVYQNRILIIAKTKALLFEIIGKKLKNKYQSEMPELYSIPIVNMDWDQAQELIQNTSRI